MKKWLVSIMAVITIVSLSTAVYASTNSLVGKKVQSEATVVLNAEELATAIIIDGTSYLPVRTISNALSVDVDYEGGKVVLVDDTKKKLGKIKSLNTQIKLNEDGIETANKIIGELSEYPSDAKPEEKKIYDELLDSAQADILDYEENIRELTTQRDALIAELQ